MISILDWSFTMFNLIGGMMFVIMMLYATPDSAIKEVLYNEQAMWGVIRRILFGIMAMGMIGKGIWTAAGWIHPTTADMIFWLQVVMPMGILLSLRVAHLIEQDRWIGFHFVRNRIFVIKGWIKRFENWLKSVFTTGGS